jgi:hypothetical protein
MLLTRRNWVLRFSIILNIVVLLYVGRHITSKNGTVDFIEELQASGRNLASIDIPQLPLDPASSGGNSAAAKIIIVDPETAGGQSNTEAKHSPIAPGSDVASSVIISTKKPTKPSSIPTSEEPVIMDLREAKRLQQVPELPQNNNSAVKILEDVVKCHDKSTDPRTAQRSDFWVLYNYIPATRKFRCHESVTYTTHADYTFLDNLVPLLQRWQGPVSLAMHAPGADFAPTLEAIRYARDCLSPLVSELVTFHVFFGTRHVPKEVPSAGSVIRDSANCSLPAPWVNVTSAALYKTKAKILYPVNIGRNIARDSALTYYILPSDIELYPSPGLIQNFLDMIRRQDPPLQRPNPKVFPLPIFELEKGVELPTNKTQLVSSVVTIVALICMLLTVLMMSGSL